MAAAEPNNAQLKAMLRRIKFSTDAATQIVTGQVINSIDMINTLTQDSMSRLCLIIFKTGGGTNRHVVSDPAENLFHLLVYHCQHQDRVTRDTDHYIVTLVNVRVIHEQRELKKDWDSTITEYFKPVFKDIPNTFEMIKELLIKSRGAYGVPFNCVIMTDLSPSDGADDPGTNYTSKDAKIIACSPIIL